MLPTDLQLLHSEPDGQVAAWRDVVLVVIRHQVTIPTLQASVRANRALASRYPHGVGALTLATNVGIRLPPADVRKAAAEAIAAVQPNVRCAAQVLVGDGFWASAARSVVTAIEMLRPDNRPRRTFGDLSAATAWMATIMGEVPAWSERLQTVAREMLERGGAQPADALRGS